MKKTINKILLAFILAMLVAAGSANSTIVDDQPVSPTNPMPSKIVDVNGAHISDVVPALVTTDIDHYIIHVGRAFIYSETFAVAATGGADTANFVISNTAADEVHLKSFSFTSTQGNAEIYLYKATTSNEDGTLADIYNMNFVSTNTSTASIRMNPTGVVAGTHIAHFLLVGGKHQGGTTESGSEEIVIKQNEKVLIQYVNNAAQADTYSFKIIFLDVGAM